MDSAHFSHTQLKRRKCHFIALVLYQIHEEGLGLHSRLPEMIIWDAWATLGSSGPTSTYREHVVPLAYLRDASLDMYKQGKSIEEVEQIWIDNYFVAKITHEEAKRLNSIPGLKYGMPRDWKFGDDVGARLKAAGIVISNENFDKIAV